GAAAALRVEPLPAPSPPALREHRRLRGPEVALSGAEVGRGPAQREDVERGAERERAVAVEEVGVVEVDVDERLVEAARERAGEHPDRVRARERKEPAAGLELEQRPGFEAE